MKGHKIAIIGMSCRFPGGVNSPTEFYEMLRNGCDCIERIPSDRWNMKFFQNNQSKHPGTMVTKRCGFMHPFYEFDHEAFSMSKKEANSIDPAIKILLEVSLDTFKDANVIYRGTRTGVFVGTGFAKYSTSVPEYINEYTATGTSLAMHSNMISYKFDLRGPSFSCDSACSSAGSAMYAAVNAMVAGDIDMALVGGYNHLLNYGCTVAFSRLGVLAPDGKGKSFSEKANGYVRSEGAGMILLKNYDQAVKDGDHIYAVVKGVGSNVDGALEPSITKPSHVAQSQLMNEVLKEKAGIEPSDVFYVEAHATGTQVGDVAEINGIGAVCGPGRQDKLRVGSVKNNVGHLEIASFLASLIKVCLMADKRVLLPTINVGVPNPKIHWDKFNLAVQSKYESMPSADEKKVFVINSFGFGGSNSCCVLESVPKLTQPASKEESIHLFVLSARTKSALQARVEQLREFSEKNPELSQTDLAYTLNKQVREDDRFFAYGVGESLHTARIAGADGKLKIQEEGDFKLCIVFSGQGPQHYDMGRDLYQKFQVFRDSIDECDQIFKRISGESILEKYGLFTHRIEGGEKLNLKDPIIGLPGLLFLQIALYDLLTSFGVKTDVTMGHSFGEMAMFYANGCLTKEQAIDCVVKRIDLLRKTKYEHEGKMMAVGCGAPEIIHAIEEAGIKNVWIAADNSPTSCTVGGMADSIYRLKEVCEKELQIFNRILKISNAYHTPLMLPVKEEGMQLFEKIVRHTKVPKIPYVSTATGTLGKQKVHHTYFCENILNFVQFRQGVDLVLKEFGSKTIFLELAPHPVLNVSIKQCHPDYLPDSILTTLSRSQNEIGSMLQLVGKLQAYQQKVAAPQEGNLLKYLPSYPFQRKDCFMKIDVLERDRTGNECDEDMLVGLIGRKVDCSILTFNGLVSCIKYPYLVDHVVESTKICPAAAMAECCLELYHQHFPEATNYLLKNFEVLRPTAVPTQQSEYIRFQTGLRGDNNKEVYVAARSEHNMEGYSDRCRAIIGKPLTEVKLESSSLAKFDIQGKELSKSEVYDRFGQLFVVALGPSFQTISRAVLGDEEVVCYCDFSHLQDHERGYVIHPVVLDTLFHSLLLTFQVQVSYLPTIVESVRVWRRQVTLKDLGNKMIVHSKLSTINGKMCIGDMIGYDAVTGEPIVELRNVQCNAVMEQPTEALDFFTVKTVRKELLVEIENPASCAKFDLPRYKSFVLKGIHKNLLRLKGLTIPDSKKPYYKWVLEQEDQKDAPDTFILDESLETTLVKNVVENFEALIRKKNSMSENPMKKLLLEGNSCRQTIEYVRYVINSIVEQNPDRDVTVLELNKFCKEPIFAPENEEYSFSTTGAGQLDFDVVIAFNEKETDLMSSSTVCPGGLVINLEWSNQSQFWTSFVCGIYFDEFEFEKSTKGDQWKQFKVDALDISILKSPLLKDRSEKCSDDVEIIHPKDVFTLLEDVKQRIAASKFSNLAIVTSGVNQNLKVLESEWEIIGFVRVLGNEYPNWSVKLIDVAEGLNKKEVETFISTHFDSLEGESVIDSDLGVHVMRCVKVPKKVAEGKLETGDEMIRLYVDDSGVLSGMKYRTIEKLQIVHPDEVICSVSAAALNFKDVMLAMNMLKGMEPRLGLEFSGRVLEVGSEVKSVKVGDDVFGFAPYCLSSHVRTSECLITKKPDNVEDEELSGVPTVFVTVYQSLVKCARIRKGETVLVHSASGGVGQAALEIIRYIGAIPICSCGSEEKREFLRENFDVKYFCDSHSSTWDEEVRQQLGGDGVDVVLNSLAGDNILKGIDLLKPFGRFIEIGKRDLIANSKIGLNPFLKNLSFFSVHIDHLIATRPEEVRVVLKEVKDLLAAGHITAVRVDKLFHFTNSIDSFKYMKKGIHKGKVILDYKPSKEDIKTELVVHGRMDIFLKDHYYIVSGGLGAVGFELSKFLVERGARNIILLSRSGRLQKKHVRQLEEWKNRRKIGESEPINVVIAKCDISSSQDVKRMIEENNLKGKSVGGVFQLAMVIEDGRIPEQSASSMKKSFAAKVTGTKNLVDQLCEFSSPFVFLFSSISSVVGNMEQSNYSAANSFMDFYAKYLRSVKNINAKVLNLGAIVDVGLIVSNIKLRKIMKLNPIWDSGMKVKQVMECIENMLATPDCVQVIPEMDFASIADFYPMGKEKFRLFTKQETEEDGEGASKGMDLQALKRVVADMMLLEIDELAEDESLMIYGVDSLSAVELSSIIKKEFRVDVSQMEILGGITINQILKK